LLRLIAFAALLPALALVLSGCTQLTVAAPVDAPPSVDAGSALHQLRTIPVKGKAPDTGYSSKTRSQLYGPAWTDATNAPMGRDGCDTRNDILGRDPNDVTFKPGTDSCKVIGGRLNDPYTGLTLDFSLTEPEAVQIDHIVALENSWITGAQGWDKAKRTRFANDPANLRAVQGKVNASKGSADFATWQPPNKHFSCAYAASQVSVKATYGLWVTAAEKAAFHDTLTGCAEKAAKQ
jgi:hypothetical protein